MTSSPLTILLVEDSRTYAELATYLLESLGHVVKHTLTVEEGLQQAQDQPPDLILMDVNFPGMGGFEAIKLLRQNPRTQKVPAVALTAESWSEKGDRAATDAGFDAYLCKPIDAKDFDTAIQRVLPHATAARKGRKRPIE